MARRRFRKSEHHGPDWHEAMLAEPWNNYSTTGDKPRPLTPREYEHGMRGKREQMEMHDRQPKRMRELVGEHNINKAITLYREEVRALPKSDRCSHGRFPESCPQCVWARAQEARERPKGRDGTEVTRKQSETVAELLARRGTWSR